ncbi:MAG: hypothetical protein JXB45_12755 [Candidatus Krumholzibacteriota bacterium]|nr:hypothetical protein [Candidatus Krumholzibacteriota bacterium]
MSKTTSPSGTSATQERIDKLEKELKRKIHLSQTLFRSFEELGGGFDLEKIIRLFQMTMSGRLSLSRAAFYLFNRENGNLEKKHSLGSVLRDLPSPETYPWSMIKYLQRVEGPVGLDDFPGPAAEKSEGDAEFIAALSALDFSHACPLAVGQELLGVVFFSPKAGGGEFSAFDLEYIRMLVKVAAVAVRNACAYQGGRRRTERLEDFYRVKNRFMLDNSKCLERSLSILKSSLYSLDEEEITGGILVNMAKDALGRSEVCLEQLLSLSDMEVDEAHLNLERTDMSSLLEDCLREFIPELEEKGISVRLKDNLPSGEITVDPSKIKIVLRNLVDNSIHAASRGGIIAVETALVHDRPRKGEGIKLERESSTGGDFCGLDEPAGTLKSFPELDALTREINLNNRREGSFYVIRIRDDGSGITPEDLNKLARPHKEGNPSPADPDRPRPSIGLALAREIVSGHGGYIYCLSEQGQGAEFSIWLPADGY